MEAIQFKLALQAVQEAKRLRLIYVVIDGSPCADVRALLEQAGAIVVEQTRDGSGKYTGGKGGALRQGIQAACSLLDQKGQSHKEGEAGLEKKLRAVIAFQEPEKIGLFCAYTDLAKLIWEGAADVVVPRRSEEAMRSLASEQYHSESFGNHHLANVLNHGLGSCKVSAGSDYGEKRSQEGPYFYDWFFGPMLISRAVAAYWLQNTSPLWDAQIVPAFQLLREKGIKRVKSVVVHPAYVHPAQQVEAEQGSPKWSGKRLQQLQAVISAVLIEIQKGFH